MRVTQGIATTLWNLETDALAAGLSDVRRYFREHPPTYFDDQDNHLKDYNAEKILKPVQRASAACADGAPLVIVCDDKFELENLIRALEASLSHLEVTERMKFRDRRPTEKQRIRMQKQQSAVSRTVRALRENRNQMR
ncbi:hypothetical protein [Roseibium sp. RKSG952]|uniref:hypothetical protein n=1 Tax=Roseibium sp. RKSG952 TaxID=2529384 RepID=UPI0012BBC149|nr:hypothetical protein [Roseibium sp. RKSG952]MTH97603.1 hypothetical protein [Roseibium sp. RKSG952]